MLKKDIYNLRYALIILFIYSIIMQMIFHTICPLKAFFHIPCPGCGLTHATWYLITLRFQKSFNANPTCILWLITIILFFIDRYFYKFKIKFIPVITIIVSIITIGIYLYRIIYILKLFTI